MPEPVLENSSVWFAAYPDSVIGADADAKSLDILGSVELHKLLSKLGIKAIHTGPMKRSGSVDGRAYGVSVDGHFDRIESAIDPDYGTEAAYTQMVANAHSQGLVIIGDLIPGHTGKGPDFRLATANEPGFTGLYTMVDIDPVDWSILPDVPKGQDSANLSQASVKALRERGYAPVGPMDVEVFARPGIKDSCWSATDIVRGVDGKERRWVYLHVFKQGQPSLNWSDPSYAAHRLITADLLHSLTVLGVKGLRLDATMFLGIEGTSADREGSWLAGHPLSNRVTDQLGLTIRKFGGFSFQELNTDLGRLKDSLGSGPEFNYDFVTRPGYLYALATGDGGPLRLMLREMLRFGVQPTRLVHGLQNHDELMLEATHLAVHADEAFEYEGHRETGEQLFRRIHERVLAKTTSAKASYNRSFAMSPGVCSTLAGFIAASIGVDDLDRVSMQEKQLIARIHLLAAAFNALQGGVFTVSGWDLVGALPLPENQLDDLVADQDYRWINRGAYDLLGLGDGVDSSVQGLPRAQSLYGNVAAQLRDPTSFASRLQAMLEARETSKIPGSELVAVPVVAHPGIVILINRLPQEADLMITVLNFGADAVSQAVDLENSASIRSAEVRWTNRADPDTATVDARSCSLTFNLLPYEGQLVIVRSVGV